MDTPVGARSYGNRPSPPSLPGFPQARVGGYLRHLSCLLLDG